MEKQQSVERKENRFVEYVLIAMVFLAVLFVGLIILRRYFATQAENQFRSQLPPLVLAGENLAALADQGVDPVEFKNRLEEVKTRYYAITDWPLSYTDAHYEYFQAIEGWSLAAEVWDGQGQDQTEYSYQERVDLERVSAFLGIGVSKIKFFTAGDLVRELIHASGEHARKGKGLLGY